MAHAECTTNDDILRQWGIRELNSSN